VSFSKNICSERFRNLLVITGFVVFCLTAILNPGIVALDDYSCIVSQIIPAQNLSFSAVVLNQGIRNPLAVTILLSLTKILYKIGVESPNHQIEVVRLLIGGLNFFVFSCFGPIFFRGNSVAIAPNLAIGLLGGFFLMPLFFSRPMIEVLSAPFLFLSCYESYKYWSSGQKKYIAISVFCLTLAAMFRFQSGICFVSILVLIFLKRDNRGLSLFILSSLLFFVLSGLVEFNITGRFHGSLIDYIQYNLSYSSGYGVTPFYTFLLLLFGLTIPPTILSKYKNLEWRKEYYNLFPTVLFVGVFVLAHSIVPHKEERFIIPILPLFLLILVPMLTHLWKEKKQRWRIYWFASVNCILLFLVSFNAPQSNVLNLMRYFEERPDIKIIKSIGDTLVLYPAAFLLTPPKVETVEIENIGQLVERDCQTAVVVRRDYEPLLSRVFVNHSRVRAFKPGPLEALLVKLNPNQNTRRGTISIYLPKDCPI